MYAMQAEHGGTGPRDPDELDPGALWDSEDTDELGELDEDSSVASDEWSTDYGDGSVDELSDWDLPLRRLKLD